MILERLMGEAKDGPLAQGEREIRVLPGSRLSENTTFSKGNEHENHGGGSRGGRRLFWGEGRPEICRFIGAQGRFHRTGRASCGDPEGRPASQDGRRRVPGHPRPGDRRSRRGRSLRPRSGLREGICPGGSRRRNRPASACRNGRPSPPERRRHRRAAAGHSPRGWS